MIYKYLYRTLLLSTLILSAVFYTACSTTDNPIDVLNEYIDSWTKQDFATMYIHISTEDKNSITELDFRKVYEDFYSGLKVQAITIEHMADKDELKKKNEPIILPVKVDMQTEYGNHSYNLDIEITKEAIDDQEEWKVFWDYNMVYEGVSEGDTILTTYSTRPVRGEILDRNGKKLAENGVAVQVGIVPGRLGDMKDEIIRDISNTFQISEEYINDRLSLSWVRDDTFVDLKKIPKDQQYLIEAIYAKNKGATYKEIEERVYPYKEVAAHLIGYIGYTSEDELQELELFGFTANDRIGRAGLEVIFDDLLRGMPGRRVVILDKESVEKEVLFEQDTVDGEDLHLTIDVDLQAKLYQQLHLEQGTAAVMNYKTGEVAALVNSPAYDPNKFILGISSDELNALQEDNAKPLLNRFTQVYSPGSTLKPITAAIALSEKIVDGNFTIDVQGMQWQMDASWGNYHVTRVKDPGEPVNMEKAMIYSDNIYFAQLALKVGGETLIDKAKDFGIGETLPLRYGVKDSQLANGNQIIHDILLADTGYGQGEVLLSILNLNKAYSTFVNEGNIVNLRLIANDTEVDVKNIISKEIADEIFGFLLKVVEDENGTGHGAYLSNKSIAGKTGTAEVPSVDNTEELEELGWFVAIDYSEDTPYITSVMVENVKDRGGSHIAIEKARDFIRAYSGS